MGLFGFLAGPLGWIMRLVYHLVNNYFWAIFLFTLIIRVILFPFSLQSQKKQADRIRLAPRVERLQKKYKDDPQKFQKKQQALYEKEGVSLTGGCLPMIVQMVVLLGIIAVIYEPLTYLSSVPNTAINAAVSAVNVETYTGNNSGYTVSQDGKTATHNETGAVIDLTTKVEGSRLGEKNYYREMYMMQAMDANRDEILASIAKTVEGDRDVAMAVAEKYYNEITAMSDQFRWKNRSLLQNPWTPGRGFGDINILWLIPLLSGVTAVITSLLTSYFTKQGMSSEKQPGQGCSNGMMFLFMPLFSLYISFTVPGGVGLYWTCSNVIAIVQTLILNLIYNPKKIRAQAEIDYQERRRQRAQMKKNNALAEARRLDDERERAEDEAAARTQTETPEEKGKKKSKINGIEVGEVKDDNR